MANTLVPSPPSGILMARRILRPILPARFSYQATCHCTTRQGSARSASMDIFITVLLAAAALTSPA